METVDFVLFILQAIALILNLIMGLVNHEVFYIAIAIIFAIFITGDSIERKLDKLIKED